MSLVLPPSASDKRPPLRVKRPNDRKSLSRSATRALDVLELFGQERRAFRAVEVSHTLAIHPSTTNQLLKTMVDSGHLVFDARSKTYLPSSRFAEFGEWIAEKYGAGGRLRGLMQDVLTGTGSTVTLSTPNDLFMQVIDLATSGSMATVRGLQISMFGSVIGSAYLSTLDEDEIARLADRARIPVAEIPRIFTSAASIRCEGHAEGMSPDGAFYSIAISLPMHGLHVPTVLAVAGPPEVARPNLERFVKIMCDSVDRWIGAAAV